MAAALASMPLPVDLHANHSYKLIVTTAVSFVLATFGIVGRFVARGICRKRLELNDYLIVLGYIVKVGLTILSSFLIHYGIGRHIQTLNMSQIESYLKGTWTGSLIYPPAIAFVKLSILSLYYAAFPSRFMKVSVWFLSAIVASWGIALCLVGVFACIPVHKSWQPMTTPGHCINQYRFYYGLQIPNIVTDFLVLLLPFKEIYNLDLPRVRLLQVGGVLALGLVTCAFDIIRLVVFIQMPQVPDQTWVNLPPSMWLDLETSVAILCACLPVMRPLLHPRRFWYTNRSRTTTAGDRKSAGQYTEMDDRQRGGSPNSHSRDGSGGNRISDSSKYGTSGSESGIEEGRMGVAK